MLVIAIEEYPEHLTNKEKLHYNRVCDVLCPVCDTIYYSQPYDDGMNINKVRSTKTL